MLFIPKKSVKKFQQGGTMAPEEMPEEAPMEGAPEEQQMEGSQNPLMMLAQAAVQALQSQDCQLAMQVCQGFIQMLQQSQGPQEPAGEPVFRKGGVLLRRIKK